MIFSSHKLVNVMSREYRLKKAIEKGYDNIEMIRNDRDLENIRDTFYYKNVLRDDPNNKLNRN